MITAIVLYDLPPHIDEESCRRPFSIPSHRASLQFPA